MKHFLAFIAAAALGAAVWSAHADTSVRLVRPLPPAANGTNAVVAVRLNLGKTVEPVAFDLVGGTASSGNVTAYQIRDFGGNVSTNVLKASAACASTNAFTVADYRSYCYANEPVYFQFTRANGGYVVIYAKTKE